MADELNKKINIDVQINTDGQQQITQYKAAFDDFRNSINSIKNPLSNISDDFKNLNKNVADISDSLNKLNSTASSFNSTGSKIGGIVNTAIGSFLGLDAIFTKLELTFGEFTAELTGGLSLLISFLPVIVDWVGDLFKADTTTKSLNQTLKAHKAAIDAVRQARLQGAQDALDEITRLKVLYKASQDHNLLLSERKKAVAQLQSQYPAYFGNLSQEAILAGKAAGQYKDLANSITAAAQARAAEDMMTDNSKRQLSDKFKTDDLQKQIDQKKQQLDALEQKYQHSVMYGNGENSSGKVMMKDNLDKLTTELAALETQYGHIATDSKILDQKNQALADDVSKNIEKNGAKIITTQDKQTASLDKYSKKLDEVNSKQKAATAAPVSKSAPGDPDIGDAIAQLAKDDEANQEANAKKQEDTAKQTLQKIIADATAIKAENQKNEDAARQARNKQIEDEALQAAQKIATEGFAILQNSIKQQADAKIAALETQKNNELSNTNLTSAQKIAIEAKFKKQEGQIKAKAFKEEQEASVAQAVINGALAITKGTAQTGVLASLYIPSIIAETAIEIAKIESQKPPAYASGGLHYSSDGRGGVLPGYSRTDNTNAHLRSGEGVVVSEAMRNPWARNLVSAINVGFGGRDFSTGANGRNFAVGGIFTDGGDANRYYNAPVNDQKNLANTIAYQMINNFPPVYVDVKDINNQQNILAQTINRVNL